MAVFDAPGAHFVGYVPLAAQPVGMATDGTWLTWSAWPARLRC